MISPEKKNFYLKRLHSLTGLALCGFILEHLFTNSAGLKVLMGDVAGASETFNSHVAFLHALPALPLIEIGMLAMPFLFHILYGFVLTIRGAINIEHYPYERNYMYVLQRVSAVVIAIFLFAHVMELRFGVNMIPRAPELMVTASTNDTPHRITSIVETYVKGEVSTAPPVRVEHPNYFAHVNEYFVNLPSWGFWFYALGILATAFHFGNGLFLAGITWGVWISRRAQSVAFLACMGLGLLLFVVGTLSVFGFGQSVGA